MADPPTNLDAFGLKEALGRGTAGTRWRARGATGEAVVDVLAPGAVPGDLTDEFLGPHLLGRGIVSAAASGGSLPAGWHWFAYEPLPPRERPRAWAELRALLVVALDTLDRAHRRGWLHLALGPEHLHPWGLDWTAPATSPACEAPEQQGPGTFGPPTDLYRMGCLAWDLATGGPPFDPGDPALCRRLHREGRLPGLLPRFPVPTDLEAWLHRLLEKAPDRRFPDAASAVAALRALPDPEPAVELGGLVPDTVSSPGIDSDPWLHEALVDPPELPG